MKKWSIYSMTILSLLTLTSCEAVGTIFKAGMWWGILLVCIIAAILLLIFSRVKTLNHFVWRRIQR
ncbi:phosphatidate cytidylyltransferase [Chryseobacterium arthrosphaerae]|uniref:Phosphatidate cytidylyltransferase n=1 Tax=Chryseobacterium arthrosphaerae TaxID=651561 RepID=A0A432DSL2_9FLAO|nr:phosphatidate cytidylyltransferase [Chryseobacterium arthrosphaerae]